MSFNLGHFGKHKLNIASIAAIAFLFSAVHVTAEEEVRQIFRVMLDEARLLRLDTPAQTLIIGNPAIADAVVNDGKTIVITGKSFGTTNFIAIDKTGKVIAEKQLQVQQPESSILTVQRGAETESYSCAPKCKPTPILGDNKEFFGNTIGQSSQRSGWAGGK